MSIQQLPVKNVFSTTVLAEKIAGFLQIPEIAKMRRVFKPTQNLKAEPNVKHSLNWLFKRVTNNHLHGLKTFPSLKFLSLPFFGEYKHNSKNLSLIYHPILAFQLGSLLRMKELTMSHYQQDAGMIVYRWNDKGKQTFSYSRCKIEILKDDSVKYGNFHIAVEKNINLQKMIE